MTEPTKIIMHGSGTSAPPRRTYSALGLTWRSDVAWPGTTAVADDGPADVVIELVHEAEIASRWSGPAGEPAWLLRIDERPLVVEPGLRGDFRLGHNSGLFHVDPDAATVACASADPADPRFLRLLLDTVLWSTALLRGVDALHASAVATENGVAAFLARTAGGKTTLTLELIRRGYPLFCDDVLAVRRNAGGVTVWPSAPLLNVPLSRLARAAPQLRTIAVLGDEAWCATTRCSTGSAPLAHLFVLERRHGAQPTLESEERGVLALRPFCLVHGLAPSRERMLFELCADLVQQAPVTRLRCGPDTDPTELADLVESVLGHAPSTADGPF